MMLLGLGLVVGYGAALLVAIGRERRDGARRNRRGLQLVKTPKGKHGRRH